MNWISRWAFFGILLCCVGSAGLLFQNDVGEPAILPAIDDEAYPLEDGSVDQARPGYGDPPNWAASTPGLRERYDAEVQPAMHAAGTAIVVGSMALAAASPPTDVEIKYVDRTGTDKTEAVSAGMVRTRSSQVTFTGTMPAAFDPVLHVVVLHVDGQLRTAVSASDDRRFSIQTELREGSHALSIRAAMKADRSNLLADILAVPANVSVKASPVLVLDVDSESFVFARGPYRLRVTFDTAELDDSKLIASNFTLNKLNDAGTVGTEVVIASVQQQFGSAGVELLVNTVVEPGMYRLTIKDIADLYGNTLKANQGATYVRDILKPVGGEAPSVRPGISGSTGPYVSFPEFTAPRALPNGFNPHDKVETRVARLYYSRDAHRVAQIVNRKVKSYNRAAVDVQRQLADKARTEAEQRTLARQAATRDAINKAQKTRQAENELRGAEQGLQSAIRELTNYRNANPMADPQQDPVIKQLDSVARSLDNRVRDLTRETQKLRDLEVVANGQVEQLDAEERLARDEQFRREVAAAHADPDTYAPGKPDSDDPVEQVSVSVIGEGLIQLRGPIKGVNLVRIMIDQMDAPVGQVRVAVHTVQINGERADRMEVVADQIQKYIDQSRFLTMQSAELLRRAVVQVASQRAEESRALYVGESQEDRDQRYLYAFFGRDFVDELKSMDSEFLRTGNKLLSLHAMDTTSLSSALMLMALAKNDTRRAIVAQFEELCQYELPRAEESYLQAGYTCSTKKQKHSSCKQPRFCLAGQNGRFESLRGFFNSEISHDDTLTPLQREFLRLAQIFKSRLITELELKQRVMERAVIEERLGNHSEELQKQRQVESAAEQQLADVQKTIEPIVRSIITIFLETAADIKHELGEYSSVMAQYRQTAMFHSNSLDAEVPAIFFLARDYDDFTQKGGKQTLSGALRRPWTLYDFSDKPGKTVNYVIEKKEGGNELQISTNSDSIKKLDKKGEYVNTREQQSTIHEVYVDGIAAAVDASKYLEKFVYTGPEEAKWRQIQQLLKELQADSPKYRKDNGLDADLPIDYSMILKLDTVQRLLDEQVQHVNRSIGRLLQEADALAADLSAPNLEVRSLFTRWVALRNQVTHTLKDPALATKWKGRADSIDQEFRRLLAANVSLSFAEANKQRSRRPLDHKKFLDMLIDETEEKYIELLEGTRAHTANIDNYLKRLTTALDDDFNTQFYFPAFRHVREASQFYDVSFGQTETTSILANNREFAKVSPAASMEFDLPKRDILLTEGINGAKAMMNDVGALANDPTFLAMAKMQSGGSTASPPPGSTGGLGVVRNVLPGLNADTAERVLSQNANGGSQFGSNLENLIPDPAIYKFETGTGYEIRPVIQPDGQAVVFHLHYLYSTKIREPVRADEKHLGRVKQHYIDTDVQLSNYELREVSRYVVALKASRTSKGVPLFEDIPIAGVLFRPLPSDESSLQQNIIMSQATIFPTLFDLMGLRWAPAVADLDSLRLQNDEFTVRGRNRMLKNRVYDYASEQVDEFLRIPSGYRRPDLYRNQEQVPRVHPNGYEGPGLDQRDSSLQEGYDPTQAYPPDRYSPGESPEGSPLLPRRGTGPQEGKRVEPFPLNEAMPRKADPEPFRDSRSGMRDGHVRPVSNNQAPQSSRRMPAVTNRGNATR